MLQFDAFINHIKENRTAEINVVKGKGYSCSTNYKFYDVFEVEYLDSIFSFSLFCTRGELIFLINEKSEDDIDNSIKTRAKYYSMESLFSLIHKYDSNHLFENAIISDQFEFFKIVYKGKLYNARIPVFDKRRIRNSLKQNKLFIELILLFALIQNKADCMFEKWPDYIDGIYRFYYVFFNIPSSNSYDSPMKKRGWVYNNGKYVYHSHIDAVAIRLEYDENNIKDENLFSKELRGETNEWAFQIFLNEYNRKNASSYIIEDVKNGIECFHINSDTSVLHSKEIERIGSIKPFDKQYNSNCFTKKAVSIAINHKIHYFVFSKFNKKYYLTKSELDEIIETDPRKSPANGGS